MCRYQCVHVCGGDCVSAHNIYTALYLGVGLVLGCECVKVLCTGGFRRRRDLQDGEKKGGDN